MRVKWISVLIVSFLVIPSLALASPLGIAGDYNVFIKNDINLKRTDSFGGVAAGGNAYFEDVSVARKINAGPEVPTPNSIPPGIPTGDLVVGGSLDFQRGSVGYFADENSGSDIYKKGSIKVGGSAVTADVGYGTIETGKQTIDFDAAWNHLGNVSSYWSTLPSNGTSQGLYNTNGDLYRVNLAGTNPDLNVFDLGGLEKNNTVNLRDLGFFLDVPSTSTILINVPGKQAFFESFGFYFWDSEWDPALSNTDPTIPEPEPYIKGSLDTAGLFPDNRILYNFYEADALTMSFIEIHGSVLAPWADVIFYEGHIQGNLIAESLLPLPDEDDHLLWISELGQMGLRPYNHGEAHDELFEGYLPVPEPTTFVLIGIGLGMLLMLGRRINAKSA